MDQISQLIALALEEDIGTGDITGDAVMPPSAIVSARFVAKGTGVLAGLGPAQEVFYRIDPQLHWEDCEPEGAHVIPGMAIATVRGSGRAILRGERLGLNLIQHLSGVATQAHQFVEAVAGTHIQILDTRKTLPGLRSWQKAAVVAGGGQNHRGGLFDRYLIKGNHRVAHGSLAEALAYFSAHRRPGIGLEIEIVSCDEIETALTVEPDWLMLDNFSPGDAAHAVALIQGRAQIEISGGIRLDTIRDYALPGVDAISVGAMTHSAPALDVHLQLTQGSDPGGTTR
jgi:nicotinate-nucleotide pyrophosphorylase (carboxylating)